MSDAEKTEAAFGRSAWDGICAGAVFLWIQPKHPAHVLLATGALFFLLWLGWRIARAVRERRALAKP